MFNNTKVVFIDNLCREFTERFPDAELGILNDINCIFNPKLLPQNQAAIRQYGDHSLDIVINKYRNDPDPVTDTVRTRNNYL